MCDAEEDGDAVIKVRLYAHVHGGVPGGHFGAGCGFILARSRNARIGGAQDGRERGGFLEAARRHNCFHSAPTPLQRRRRRRPTRVNMRDVVFDGGGSGCDDGRSCGDDVRTGRPENANLYCRVVILEQRYYG